MANIASVDLAPVGHARVDTEYIKTPVCTCNRAQGAKPTFTDREVITLLW